MDLSLQDRVALRLSDTAWAYRRINQVTVRRLRRLGLIEERYEGGAYETRLTEKGAFAKRNLPPEPRPSWHDPEWMRTNWKLDHLPEPPAPSAAERAGYGWYDGQPTSPIPSADEEATRRRRIARGVRGR